ncbi:MAG: hypothetical protein K2H09_03795 [Treponemataceae bacterium]|nr:hypothetical protein [Treponemataceae bacterium]
MKAERKSFVGALDSIDALIQQKQYKDALQELEQIEKKAYGSWEQLGIFRRYASLGEQERAEKTLVRALKKNPENLELVAVYCNFLTRAGRTEAAAAAGRRLSGTKYGSVYSEALLRDAARRTSGDEFRAAFRQPDYYSVYLDAYAGTKDNAWLRNCAALCLASGAYEQAAAVQPDSVSDVQDSYFWALVMYDARHYGDSIRYAEAAQRLAAYLPEGARTPQLMARLAAVASDSYIALSEGGAAEEMRRQFIGEFFDSLARQSDGSAASEADSRLLPVIFTNSARWASEQGDDDECFRLLSFAVNRWQDFVPALALYADFAWRSSSMRAEDSLQRTLRDEGLATLEMEAYNNRVQVPVSDAVERIARSLERNPDALLYIVNLDLKYKQAAGMSEREKTADLWRVMEENAVAPGVYPPLILDYALSYLLASRHSEEAWRLYFKCMSNQYDIPIDADFWQNLVQRAPALTKKEVEYAAYFAAHAKRADDAVFLYESCVFEPSGGAVLSPKASDRAALNLAAVYSSLRRTGDALDLYGKIAGRTTNLKTKSLAMYRMARLYYDLRDIQNARRSVEYAVTLDPENAEARLLLNKIDWAK